MILEALANYYDVLCATGQLTLPGWEDEFKVSFGLNLNDAGEVTEVIDLRRTVTTGKKAAVIPSMMRVPAHSKRGTNVVPCFLCDNGTYLLGRDNKGLPLHTEACLAGTAAFHNKLLAASEEPEAKAILKFFKVWNPENAEEHPAFKDYWERIEAGANMVFCYDGKPVTELPYMQEIWQAHYDAGDPDAKTGQCLITGDVGKIARLHPSIKGLRGGQATGTSLVSFNCDSFCSYGLEQGANAPVSFKRAFAYSAALNTLLAHQERCVPLGDTTVVFWSETANPAYQEAFHAALTQGAKGDNADENLVRLFDPYEDRIMWNGEELNPYERFFILGITPNAARIAIKFFVDDGFEALLKNIKQHYEDINIMHSPKDVEYLPLWRIMCETVPKDEWMKKKDKCAPHMISEQLVYSILSGTPYSDTLLYHIQRRIAIEREIPRAKAAFLKAYFLRSTKYKNFPKEVLKVEGDSTSRSIPYTLGRMFAVYEQLQNAALPELNRNIADTYFVSASTTPHLIFPVIDYRSKHHLKVLSRDKKGLASYYRKRLQNFAEIIGEEFPKSMDIAEKGAFQLGYYFESNHSHHTKPELSKEEN